MRSNRMVKIGVAVSYFTVLQLAYGREQEGTRARSGLLGEHFESM
jgi:hypothetical protein